MVYLIMVWLYNGGMYNDLPYGDCTVLGSAIYSCKNVHVYGHHHR